MYHIYIQVYTYFPDFPETPVHYHYINTFYIMKCACDSFLFLQYTWGIMTMDSWIEFQSLRFRCWLEDVWISFPHIPVWPLGMGDVVNYGSDTTEIYPLVIQQFDPGRYFFGVGRFVSTNKW